MTLSVAMTSLRLSALVRLAGHTGGGIHRVSSASRGRSTANTPTLVVDFYLMPRCDEPSCTGKAGNTCTNNRDMSDDHDGDPGIRNRLRCWFVRTI